MQDMWFHYMQTVDKLQIFIASLCNSIFLNESLANVWLFFIVLTSTEFFSLCSFPFLPFILHFFLSRLEFELPGLSASTFLHHFSAIAKKYSQRIHFKPSENNNNEKKCY